MVQRIRMRRKNETKTLYAFVFQVVVEILCFTSTAGS